MQCARIMGKCLKGGLSSLCLYVYAALSCTHASHLMYKAGHMHRVAMSYQELQASAGLGVGGEGRLHTLFKACVAACLASSC